MVNEPIYGFRDHQAHPEFQLWVVTSILCTDGELENGSINLFCESGLGSLPEYRYIRR